MTNEGILANAGVGIRDKVEEWAKRTFGEGNYVVDTTNHIVLNKVLTVNPEFISRRAYKREIPTYIRFASTKGLRVSEYKGNDYRWFPTVVEGDCYIQGCKIESLSGIKTIIGDLRLLDCSIDEIGVESIGGSVTIDNVKKLKDLKTLCNVTGDLEIKNCGITSLEGCPEKVLHFTLANLPKLKSLRYCPKVVGGGMFITKCPLIDSVEYLPLTILKTLYWKNNGYTPKKDEIPNNVCRSVRI